MNCVKISSIKIEIVKKNRNSNFLFLFMIAWHVILSQRDIISKDVVKSRPKLIFMRNRVSLPVEILLKVLFSIEET